MNLSKKITTIVLIIFSFINLNGQNSKLDSLLNLYNRANYDSTRCRLMLEIGDKYQNLSPDTSINWYSKVYSIATKTISKEEIFKYYAASALQSIGLIEYNYFGNFDKAMEYSNRSFIIFENLAKSSNTNEIIKKSFSGIILSYRLSGLAYFKKGNYDAAIENISKSLALCEKSGNKIGIAECYVNFGLIHSNKGSYKLAIEYLFKALKTKEELNDKNGMATCYGNIANIYLKQRNYNKSIEYNFKALKISEELGFKKGIALSYGNIGIAIEYMAEEMQQRGGIPDSIKNNQLQALNYFLKSLKISEEIGDIFQMSSCYNNIGIIYAGTGNKTLAIEYFSKSMNIAEEMGDVYNLVISYVNFAELNLSFADSSNSSESTKYIKTAIKYGDKGYALAKEIKSISAENMAASSLMNAYKKSGNYKKAMEYAYIFIATNDSLFKEQQTNAIANAEAKFNSEKKQLQIDKLNKEKELQEETNKRQKNVIFFICFGLLLLLIIVLIIFRSLRVTKQQKKIITKEKQRSEELLLNILPSEVAEELKEKGYADAKQFDEVTVLFTDFKGFTSISEKLSPHDLVKEIDECFKEFDRITEKYGIEKIKTIGDSYMCAGGLPVKKNTSPEDTVKAALEIRDFMLHKKNQLESLGKTTFEIRIGIHTGPVVAGIVGIKKFAYDIWGDTVNIASRMESSGEPGKVNISGSTYELVKNKFNCTCRGKIEAKNKGMIDMYFVENL